MRTDPDTSPKHLASFSSTVEDAKRRLSDSLDLSGAVSAMLAAMVEELGASRASLMVVNPDTGRLRIVAGIGIPSEAIGHDLKPAVRRISDWVLREGRPLILNGQVQDQRFEASAPRMGIESAISMPLGGSSGKLGVLNVARGSSATVFTVDDLERLQGLVPSLANWIELMQELDWALRGWQAMRRHVEVRDPDCHVTRHYQIAYAVRPTPVLAGDVYERFTHANGSQTLLLADVPGRATKAIEAAALTRGLFLAHAHDSRAPAEMVRLMNRELFAQSLPVALWVVQLLSSGEVISCNAGYPSPMWVPIDGSRAMSLHGGGNKAGAEEHSEYEQERIQLLFGDLVLAVSNGLLEANDAAGRPLGVEQVEELVTDLRRQPPDRIVTGLCEAAIEHAGIPRPADDVAALAFRFTREE